VLAEVMALSQLLLQLPLILHSWQQQWVAAVGCSAVGGVLVKHRGTCSPGVFIASPLLG
jgi:hypothetical protein